MPQTKQFKFATAVNNKRFPKNTTGFVLMAQDGESWEVLANKPFTIIDVELDDQLVPQWEKHPLGFTQPRKLTQPPPEVIALIWKR